MGFMCELPQEQFILTYFNSFEWLYFLVLCDFFVVEICVFERNSHFSWSLQTDCVLKKTFINQLGMLWAQGSAPDENLRSSLVFSEHVSHLNLNVAFSVPPYTQLLLNVLISPKNLTLASLWNHIIFHMSPPIISCPKYLQIYSLHTAFINNTHSLTSLRPELDQTETSPSGSPQTDYNTVVRSALLPLI